METTYTGPLSREGDPTLSSTYKEQDYLLGIDQKIIDPAYRKLLAEEFFLHIELLFEQGVPYTECVTTNYRAVFQFFSLRVGVMGYNYGLQLLTVIGLIHRAAVAHLVEYLWSQAGEDNALRERLNRELPAREDDV